MKSVFLSSSQDGGISRNTLFPFTTKRRITTNLRTLNSQNFQEIKLHGTPTTNKLNKHSSSPVGGMEMAAKLRGHVAVQQLEDWVGEAWLADWETRLKMPRCKKLWALWRWEKLPVSQESSLESGTRVEQVSSIVPSLTSPPHTVPQRRKESCPTLANT